MAAVDKVHRVVLFFAGAGIFFFREQAVVVPAIVVGPELSFGGIPVIDFYLRLSVFPL